MTEGCNEENRRHIHIESLDITFYFSMYILFYNEDCRQKYGKFSTIAFQGG